MTQKQHRILISNSSGRNFNSPALKKAICTALEQQDVPWGEVSVLVTGDEEIQELNKNWRGIDEPTDVLTFVDGEFPGGALGDIVISADTCERQADAHGMSFADELSVLGIHGALHLAGLDDETPDDQAEMMQAMAAISAQVGIEFNPNWSTLEASSGR